MLFTAREVCIGKNCTDLWPYLRPRAQFFPVRIDLGLQIKFFIFFLRDYCEMAKNMQNPRQDNKTHFRCDSARYRNP